MGWVRHTGGQPGADDAGRHGHRYATGSTLRCTCADPRSETGGPRAQEALEAPAFYVGALGSHRNSDARRERLVTFGLSESSLARLHAPVGLQSGGTTPPEIALSIVAGVTASRHSVPVSSLRDAEVGKWATEYAFANNLG
ncbi:hypothetical protein PCAR4_570005 [Paraburkholderia caribensis]|nr:hypothetical protein PCAR4_570005 [Paraburkholderia caribensis]